MPHRGSLAGVASGWQHPRGCIRRRQAHCVDVISSRMPHRSRSLCGFRTLRPCGCYVMCLGFCTCQPLGPRCLGESLPSTIGSGSFNSVRAGRLHMHPMPTHSPPGSAKLRHAGSHNRLATAPVRASLVHVLVLHQGADGVHHCKEFPPGSLWEPSSVACS
jgi:hypothetical protein